MVILFLENLKFNVVVLTNLSLHSQKLRKEVEDSQQKLAETKAKLQSVESKSGWFERRLAETEVFVFLTFSRTFNFNLFCEIPVLILPLSYQTFPCRLEGRILSYIVMATWNCYICLYLLLIACEVCYGPSISAPSGNKRGSVSYICSTDWGNR